MNCPVCNNPLKNIKYENQSIDVCLNCAGMWFDAGELQQVINSLISENKVDYQTVKESYRRNAIVTNRNNLHVRKCPKCNADMNTFNYCYDSNVLLDRCSSCGGIWADKGEVEEVAKYIKGNPRMDKYAEALGKAQGDLLIFEQETKDSVELSQDLMSDASGNRQALALPIFPIPLKVDLPTQKFAKITFGIIVVNILIFIFQLIFISDKMGKSYVNLIGLIPSLALSINRLYSFITSMFVHGSIIHMLGNMYYLWLFGNNIEDKIGQLRFTIFYLLCGIIGGIVFCLVNPSLNKPAIGASGAISGVLGAYLVLYPKADLKTLWLGKVRTMSAGYYLLFWIIFQLFSSFTPPKYRSYTGCVLGPYRWFHIRINFSSFV